MVDNARDGGKQCRPPIDVTQPLVCFHDALVAAAVCVPDGVKLFVNATYINMPVQQQIHFVGCHFCRLTDVQFHTYK